MSYMCARVLARLSAALFVVVGITGCVFEPGVLSPIDELEPDGGPRPDSSPPVDSRLTPDSMAMVDGSLPPIDASTSNQRRKQITIQSSRVEAPPGPRVLTDFPVLFSVTDEDIAARATTDGRDIYFVAADGVTRLDFEIEKWVPGTGELVAWVKLPQLSATSNTVFYVHYGDPDQAGSLNPRDVWTNDFVAVWHLAQNPGPGGAGDIVDSTTGNDGTARNMQANDLVTGRVGNALDFDGSNDEITFDNPISGAGPHTISAWVNQRSTTSHDALVVLGNDAPSQARWFYSAYFDNKVAFGFYANDRDPDLVIVNQGWKLLHWTFDGASNRLYVDGALEYGPIAPPNGGINTQGSDGRIGNTPPGTPGFGSNMNLDGQADEVRIATTARSAEWIQTEFNNQSSPSTFYAVGEETP